MPEALSLLAWGPDGWGDELAGGLAVTVGLAVTTLPFGLLLGFAIALAKNSRNRLVAGLGNLYTTVFRGIPELLTLLIVYYGGEMLLRRILDVVAPDAQIGISSFGAGVVALAVVFAAFASEVFLAALRAVPRGQVEASRSLGLSGGLTLRLVVFPQLWRVALPGLGNLWLVLLKDTSLVSVIALADLLRMTNIAVGATKQPFLFYLVACLIYLALAGLSSFGVATLEARAARGEARGRS